MAFALIVTIVGFLLLMDKLGIINSEVWSFFWPILIIFIGLSMMYNKMYTRSLFRDDYGGTAGAKQRRSHRKT